MLVSTSSCMLCHYIMVIIQNNFVVFGFVLVLFVFIVRYPRNMIMIRPWVSDDGLCRASVKYLTSTG